MVSVSFIKTLLLALCIVPSKLDMLKKIDERSYSIVLSKSTSFPLRIKIDRSLTMMLQLISVVFTCLFVLLRNMRLLAWLNNCVLLWLIGLWKKSSAHDNSRRFLNSEQSFRLFSRTGRISVTRSSSTGEPELSSII